MESKTGDVVKFPNGDLGIITSWDIICGGNVKEIKIYSFVGFCKYFIGIFRYSCWRFCEDEINQFTKVGTII
jgi:hypothetical protein